ncbi:MAG: hypothetical protein SLAVMIC_00443 [uncultured marine phage]|uniref:Uncharacterized protein n=1 Tax=uncultured marine phage TaxID=707152 RepID=A0A8D9CD24_9VIRU|nr:MAG: hypothetical protein SLAVMIC_00443 [uncultured marine phage]
MNKITNKNDIILQSICKTASISAMELLQKFELNSIGWELHTSGLSFGIWISICDQDKISLDDVNDLINEMVKSNLN